MSAVGCWKAYLDNCPTYAFGPTGHKRGAVLKRRQNLSQHSRRPSGLSGTVAVAYVYLMLGMPVCVTRMMVVTQHALRSQ